MDHEILRESTFFIGGGGTGLRGGEGHQSIVYKLGRLKPVLFATGGVTVFFGKEKIYPCRLVDSSLLTNTRSL